MFTFQVKNMTSDNLVRSATSQTTVVFFLKHVQSGQAKYM